MLTQCECRTQAVLVHWEIIFQQSEHYLTYEGLPKSPECRFRCYRDILANI